MDTPKFRCCTVVIRPDQGFVMSLSLRVEDQPVMIPTLSFTSSHIPCQVQQGLTDEEALARLSVFLRSHGHQGCTLHVSERNHQLFAGHSLDLRCQMFVTRKGCTVGPSSEEVEFSGMSRDFVGQ